MPDARFFVTLEPLTAAEALRLAGADAANVEALISRAGSLEDADLSGAVVFVDRLERVSDTAARRPALLFAPLGAAGAGVAAVKDPRAAYAAVARALHRERGAADGGPAPRIGAGSMIDPSAKVGPAAEIGAGSSVGSNTVIGPGVILGERAVVGPNAVITCAIVGDDCRIGAGAVIGGPGFGFAAGPSGISRVPQLGRVVLGDRVEIGANTTIDRGAIGDTVVGAGTKLDNLVQIGHNVRIGRDCLLAAQVGIAGSTVIGDRVMFGGQAGIADHLTIGDDARLAARAGLMHDVPAGETWGGAPARPIRLWMKEIAMLARMVRSPGKVRDRNKD